jgi:hypothetical protein
MRRCGVTIHHGHIDIHEHYFRAWTILELRDKIFSVAGFDHYLVPYIFNEGCESVSKKHMIVYQTDCNI